MLILIVDDEIKVARSLQSILQIEGLESQIVTSGTAAFAELARRHYDIVLLDLHMPQVDGTRVLEHINSHYPQTNVIVVSGESEIRKAVHVLKSGARDFIRKPYTPEELLFSINNVCEKIQLERDNQAMIETLQESEALHRFIVHHSPDLVYMLDQQGHFTFVNKNVLDRLGLSRKEILGQHYSTVIYHEDLDLANRHFKAESALKLGGKIELRLQGKKQGNIVHVEIRTLNIERKVTGGGYRLGPARRSGRNVIGTYGVARDISDQKRSEEIIRFQHNHDLLTGLPNRSLLHERLSQLINRARSTGDSFALILIDINRFKLINDTYSQATGDRTLRRFAERLRRCCTQVDTLARIGGDEFALLMPSENPEKEALARAKMISLETATPLRDNGHEIHLSISMGIAIYPEHGGSCEELMKNVDTALCNLKNRSINSYGFYDSSLQNKNSQKVFTENLIRSALKNDHLIVYYQPLINLGNMRVNSLEALARIQLPSGNTVLPGQFIETAEETTLINDIGQRVIEKTCQDLKDWNRRGIFVQVSINISAIQLQMDTFAGKVLELIRFYGLNPGDFELELTENVLVQDLRTTVANIVELAGYGIKIAVDDFGTGYSSLCYLDRLPLHTLKLDKSFIQKINEDHPEDTIIPAMIRVAEGLQLRFVAEGVETQQQHEYLQQQGGSIGQGYYYSRPLAKDQATDYILVHNYELGVHRHPKRPQASSKLQNPPAST